MAKQSAKLKMKSEKAKEPMITHNQQVMRGRVVSAKSPKTAIVLVEGTKKHPLYGKSSTRGKRYAALSAENIQEGDLVEIIKIRPISKHKHFQILRVVGKDMEAIVTEKLKEEAKAAIEEVMPIEEESATGETGTTSTTGLNPRDTRDTLKTRGTRKTKEAK